MYYNEWLPPQWRSLALSTGEGGQALSELDKGGQPELRLEIIRLAKFIATGLNPLYLLISALS